MARLSPQHALPRSTEDFSRLVHLIYEAALRPQSWNDVVAAIGESMGASKGLLLTPYIGPQDGGFIFPWCVSEQELQLWATRYIEHDLWSRRANEKGMWCEGAAYVNDDMVPTQEMRGSVFYKEFLRPIGIEWICTGIVFEGAPGLPRTSMPFFRGPQAPGFSEQDKSWLKLLLPHVSRAVGLMHRFKASELRAASLRAALDHVAFGVALLNSQRQVLHLNATARAVLARGDGLMLSRERTLDTLAVNCKAPLSQWLALATVAARDARPTHFSDGFLVPRRQANQQYFLQYSVLPQGGDCRFEGESVNYLVFITDPAATRLPTAERLVAMYGLTKAEARVTLELAQGKSQKELARDLDVSLSTARTHTQKIFAKTHTKRHADLVKTILSLGQVAA